MHRYRSPRMRLHLSIAHFPPATPNIIVHTGPGFRCEWRECWGFHGLRLTKEAEEPLEDQKLATKTPRQRLNSNDQSKSTDFCKTWLHGMSHGPTWCSRSTVLNGFGEGTARANDRGIRCEGGSQCSFAPQGWRNRLQNGVHGWSEM